MIWPTPWRQGRNGPGDRPYSRIWRELRPTRRRGTSRCFGKLLKDRGRPRGGAGRARRGDRRLRAEIAAETRRSFSAHVNLGFALRQRGKLDEAIAEYREAIRLKPDYAVAHDNLGARPATRGSWTRRSPNTARPSGSSPTSPDCPQQPRHCLSAQGKLDEAMAEYREASGSSPTYAEAHNNLGIALARAGEAGRGDRRIPRGAPAQARLTPRPTTTSASPCQTRGSSTRRSPSSAKRSGSSPTTPRPTTTSATPWSEQGKLDEAIAEYREAIRLKPDFAEAHNNLGTALHGQGKLDEAIAEYREAIRLKPDYRRGPQQPRHRPAQTRGSWTRRSPSSAQPSGSSPTTPRPTPTSATP